MLCLGTVVLTIRLAHRSVAVHECPSWLAGARGHGYWWFSGFWRCVVRSHSGETSWDASEGGHYGAEQRDEADEARLEAGRGMVAASRHGVAVTEHHGAVVRLAQLIA
jgi:hypothetical protein